MKEDENDDVVDDENDDETYQYDKDNTPGLVRVWGMRALE